LREKSLRPLAPDEATVFTTGQPMWQLDGTRFKAVVPFTAVAKCRQCHAVPEGTVLGAADMSFSLDRIALAIRNNWIRSIWIIYAAISIALILSILAFRALVERRLKTLLTATRVIGAGDLTYEGARKVVAQDELGELAESFETMRHQLRKAEEEKLHSERLAMVGKMASSIVHDFRTPMSTINLAVESLQKGNNVSPERIHEWYTVIHLSVRRMVMMAQELLDFSRGEMRIEKQETNIDNFIDTLAQSVRPGLEQAHVTLQVTPRFPGDAMIDAERLHRAFVNIINNAQDAMPKGGMLSIRTEKNNGLVRFEIQDTGVGVPPEIKDRMFDAFVTAGKTKGTGLGLAITKRIIDQHGGSIFVESNPGKGTMFRIEIPVQ
jgi:signal transduction histidine kinase